jgi:hypothetical protein
VPADVFAVLADRRAPASSKSCTTASAPSATSRAQQAGKPPTIGLLGAETRSGTSDRVAAFVQRLRELGWIRVAPSR